MIFLGHVYEVRNTAGLLVVDVEVSVRVINSNEKTLLMDKKYIYGGGGICTWKRK